LLPRWLRDLLDAVFLPAPTPTPRPAPRPVPTPTPSPSVVAAELLRLHNLERARVGLPPLAYNAILQGVAEAQARRMAAAEDLDHMLGGSAEDRIAAAGYRYLAASENIGEGERDPAEAVRAWLNSPRHRANVLGDHFRDLGGAMARAASGDPYWCCCYGRR
jgi:uncharacterized protein YkwD